MKTRYFTFSAGLLIVCAGTAVPQAKSLGLSGAFSSAATELARTVDSYAGVTEVGIPEISDALSPASALAHSQGEQQAMKVLRTFLEDKMNNNELREAAVAKALAAWKNKHSAGSDVEVRQEALESPGAREMTRREDDCAAELTMVLRSGTFHEPERCTNVRLSRDEHAMRQYFPASVVAGDAKP